MLPLQLAHLDVDLDVVLVLGLEHGSVLVRLPLLLVDGVALVTLIASLRDDVRIVLLVLYRVVFVGLVLQVV